MIYSIYFEIIGPNKLFRFYYFENQGGKQIPDILDMRIRVMRILHTTFQKAPLEFYLCDFPR